MKNKSVLSFAVLCLCAFFLASCTASDKKVSTQKVGKVKIHTYSSDGANAVVVENTKLVIFDSFGGSEADSGFKTFVNSLKKPIDRIFISHSDDHHWIGINTLFPNVDLYSTDESAISKNPKSAGMSVKALPTGQITVDGITYEFVNYNDLGAYVIKMPAQKIAMTHHLGYAGFHVPIPPLDVRLNILKALQKEGCTWFIGGHGNAMKADKFISEVEKYNTFVQNTVASYKTPEEAKDVIVTRYSDWGGKDLLDIFLPMFYNN